MTIISKELIFKTVDSVRANFPHASESEVIDMVAVNLCTSVECVASVVTEREQEAA